MLRLDDPKVQKRIRELQASVEDPSSHIALSYEGDQIYLATEEEIEEARKRTEAEWRRHRPEHCKLMDAMSSFDPDSDPPEELSQTERTRDFMLNGGYDRAVAHSIFRMEFLLEFAPQEILDRMKSDDAYGISEAIADLGIKRYKHEFAEGESCYS